MLPLDSEYLLVSQDAMPQPCQQSLNNIEHSVFHQTPQNRNQDNQGSKMIKASNWKMFIMFEAIGPWGKSMKIYEIL
jgi:hypothetical protein